MSATIQINGHRIGPGSPAYVIAEMSANHGQSLSRAFRIVEAAKTAGADAIKLQTYTADTLTIRSDREPFQVGKGTIWEGRTLHDLYTEAHTPWEWQPRLKQAADRLGIDCFSSPFDGTAVEFLETMDVPAYKIASFEIVDTDLIRRVARTGKPIILSTGMASLAEIEEALRTARDEGATDLALLKCTSAYPSPPEEMNLRTIPDLANRFGVPVGLSDHTLGIAVPTAAVTLGACIVEKHLTIDREFPGPDGAFSLEPAEFHEMVLAVRTAERAMGSARYEVGRKEAASRVFRRSLFVVKDVKAGEAFTDDNVRSIRPGHGLPPGELEQILGKTAERAIERGTPLSWDLIRD